MACIAIAAAIIKDTHPPFVALTPMIFFGLGLVIAGWGLCCDYRLFSKWEDALNDQAKAVFNESGDVDVEGTLFDAVSVKPRGDRLYLISFLSFLVGLGLGVLQLLTFVPATSVSAG